MRTALLILTTGHFRMQFPGRSVLLERQCDCVVRGQGGSLLVRRGQLRGHGLATAFRLRIRRPRGGRGTTEVSHWPHFFRYLLANLLMSHAERKQYSITELMWRWSRLTTRSERI